MHMEPLHVHLRRVYRKLVITIQGWGDMSAIFNYDYKLILNCNTIIMVTLLQICYIAVTMVPKQCLIHIACGSVAL